MYLTFRGTLLPHNTDSESWPFAGRTIYNLNYILHKVPTAQKLQSMSALKSGGWYHLDIVLPCVVRTVCNKGTRTHFIYIYINILCGKKQSLLSLKQVVSIVNTGL